MDALQITAEGRQVEVGLKDLLLGPARFEGLGGQGLIPFLAEGAAWHAIPAEGQLRIEQTRQLHRKGGRTAFAVVPQVVPQGAGESPPIHAGMLEEALVLGGQQGFLESRRQSMQADPLQPPHPVVEAFFGQRRAIAGEQNGHRRRRPGLDLGEGRNRLVGVGRRHGANEARHQGEAPDKGEKRGKFSGRTHDWAALYAASPQARRGITDGYCYKKCQEWCRHRPPGAPAP